MIAERIVITTEFRKCVQLPDEIKKTVLQERKLQEQRADQERNLQTHDTRIDQFYKAGKLQDAAETEGTIRQIKRDIDATSEQITATRQQSEKLKGELQEAQAKLAETLEPEIKKRVSKWIPALTIEDADKRALSEITRLQRVAGIKSVSSVELSGKLNEIRSLFNHLQTLT